MAKEPAEGNLPAVTLQQLSALDQGTFDQSLPQLRQALEQPSHKPAASWQTLTAIAAKLRRTAESAPGYWPTVLRFIQFASSSMAPKEPPPGQPPRILSDILTVGLMRGIRENGKTILFDAGDLGNGEFINCRVILHSKSRPAATKCLLPGICTLYELPITDMHGPILFEESLPVAARFEPQLSCDSESLIHCAHRSNRHPRKLGPTIVSGLASLHCHPEH